MAKIIGFHPRYSIDEHGNVFSEGKPMKTYADKRGYLAVYLYDGHNNRKYISVHRLVMLTLSPINNPSEMTVNHKDGNKTNNHISNLEWMTNADNMRHSFRELGRKTKGIKKGQLTSCSKEDLVKAFNHRKEHNTSYRALQKLFGINRATLQYQFNNNISYICERF